jgi:hypothetical protein
MVAGAQPSRLGGENNLLDDVRIKTMRRSTPSAFNTGSGTLARTANSTSTRYSGSQAMSLSMQNR